MIQALVSLKSLIKTKSYHIDHPVFRLHYQATVGVLLAFCLILTAKVLFGDPIDCRSDTDTSPKQWADEYCFSKGTFTKYYSPPNIARRSSELTNYDLSNDTEVVEQDTVVIESMESSNHRQSNLHNYLHPGIPMTPSGSHHEKKYWHRYYQYMSIILFLQAAFFYLPHYLWKYWENGIVSSICKQLNENRFAPGDFIESNYHIIDYLQNCFTLHGSLVYKYFFCEVLLLANLLLQVIVLNDIFNDQYITYGLDVIKFWSTNRFGEIYNLRDDEGKPNSELNDPMNFVFPKMTLCKVDLQAQTGEIKHVHYICILKLNILHDKFFFILWLWLLVLAVITVLQIICDLLYIAIPLLRKHLFLRRFGPYLTSNSPSSFSLPELFLLDLIGSNTDKFAFSALLNKLNNSGLV